jgi:hypothetical protein
LGGTDSNIKKYEIPLVASTNENGATKVFSDLGLRV